MELSKPTCRSYRIFKKCRIFALCEMYILVITVTVGAQIKAIRINTYAPEPLGLIARERHVIEPCKQGDNVVRENCAYFLYLCELIIRPTLRRRPVAKTAAGGSRRANIRFGSIHIRRLTIDCQSKPSLFFVSCRAHDKDSHFIVKQLTFNQNGNESKHPCRSSLRKP